MLKVNFFVLKTFTKKEDMVNKISGFFSYVMSEKAKVSTPTNIPVNLFYEITANCVAN